MQFLDNNIEQIAAILGVAIILSLGRAKILPGVRQSKALLWVAFVITAICGLILGWALAGFVAWAMGITSVGGFSIVGVLAVWAGWHAVSMLVDLIRDLADGQPDDDARTAALWIPTLLPAGWQAVWEIASNPRGLGTGVTAALMAAITIGYTFTISNKAIKGKKGKTAWLWFAAAVCLLGGLAATPLVLYVDGWLAGVLPAKYLWASRIVAGTTGAALAVAALKDVLSDKRPDAFVRAFLQFGLPLVLAFGALAVGFLADGATNGAEFLNGVA